MVGEVVLDPASPFDESTEEDLEAEVMQEVLKREGDGDFTALGGDGDLADLTKGNDKRETVVFRG